MSNNPPQNQALVKKEAASYLSNPSIASEVQKVLPQHIKAERFMRIVQTTVMRNDLLLAAASHPQGKLSLMDAIMRCSQAGLEPDGRLAHFVPFWNKDKGCYEVQVIFDWKGLVTLGIRNGFESVFPDMVCENDKFEAWVENGEKKLIHKIDYKKERGKPYAFYCVTVRNKILDYEIMTWQETELIRERSRAGNKGPWMTDSGEMRKKCPIRRMAKRWDLLPEIRDVIFSGDDDTPPALDAPKEPTKPLFTSPEPTKQLESPEVSVVTEGLEEEAKKLIESIEKKQSKDKVSGSELMGFLTGSGICPDDAKTLLDVPVEVLRMVDEQFSDMAVRIKGEAK